MYIRCISATLYDEGAENTLILVDNVSVGYGDSLILKDINLKLDKGMHLLLGKNGSGKSTLMKTIAGIIKPFKGKVTVFGKDVHKLSRSEAVKLVGYAWQNPYAGFVEVTVKDELEFEERITRTNLNREIVELLVPKYMLNRNPFTLSGGEAKRVALAITLALDQPVWLLDEPFDYLDSEGVEAVIKVIEYGLSKGKIVVVASANTAYINMLKVDRVILIHEGRKVLEGKLDEIDNNLLKNLGIPSKAMICG